MNNEGNILETLREIYKEARRVARLPVVLSKGRGVPRFPDTSERKTHLSAKLLIAFDRTHDVEAVLQRTIVEVMHEPRDVGWFNEFNVAGGWGGGGTEHNRHAVDLGRIIPIEQLHIKDDEILSRYKLDLFELKRWDNKSDSPYYAACEIFTCFAAFWSLVLRRDVSPYEETLNSNVGVRLAVIAPAQYFQYWGYDTERRWEPPKHKVDLRDNWLYDGNRIFVQFYDALNLLKSEFPELMRVTFHPHAVVLKDIDKEEFVDDLFDWESICQHHSADTPRVALKQGAADLLKKWVTDALQDAYM